VPELEPAPASFELEAEPLDVDAPLEPDPELDAPELDPWPTLEPELEPPEADAPVDPELDVVPWPPPSGTKPE
jgi:hypothetical protein